MEKSTFFVPWAEVVSKSKPPTQNGEIYYIFVPWAKVVGKSKPPIQKWVKM